MSKITPSLHARGIYTLQEPFANITALIYECTAIRSFKDYLDLGESAYEKVYQPKGLTLEDFQADSALGANIVTLSSLHHPTILVPDTYIAKYPDLEYVEYANVAISAALGAIPNDLDLTLLQAQVAAVISDVIGVTPIVRIHAYGSAGVVTLAQHELNELARNAAITNRTTDRARVIQLLAEKAELEERITNLEEAIEGLSP